MNIAEYKINITFTEPLLGSAPGSADVYNDYIRSKEPTGDPGETADEMQTLPDGEKGITVFHRLECGTPILYDYVVMGFMKDACGMLSRAKDTRSSKVKAYKKVIDGLVFVEPRQIPIQVVGEITLLSRPLRAETMQGPRVALACSEMIPAGSSMQFTVQVFGDTVDEALLKEWFEDYGRFRGLGQWRNGSYGRIAATVEPV